MSRPHARVGAVRLPAAALDRFRATSWTSTIFPTCCRSTPGTRSRRPATVDVGTLGPILDSLQAQQPERPLGWFERFKRWLRAMLERRSGSSDNWLSRWLEETDVSDVVATVILFVALALILALTIFVIVNELRAAGSLP